MSEPANELNLDNLLQRDEHGFFAALARLPGSYDGPDGLRPEPYGLIGYGEAANLPPLLSSWVDAPVVLSGTQFVLAGGFDYGDAAPFKLQAELGGAEVVVLGHGVHAPDLAVAPEPTSLYTYAGYLAHATGHAEPWREAERAMLELAAALGPEVETARNPAKLLAWSLWNRVPLILASRRLAGLGELVQRALARVGKALAIDAGLHPLELLAGAFEGRHQLADDVVGLVLGEDDDETRLAQEVLQSRVAQLERLSLPFGGVGTAPEDAAAHGLVLWYAALWVAGYLATLHQLTPLDSPVYEALRGAAPRPASGDEEDEAASA